MNGAVKDARFAIVAWALWLHRHRSDCTYSRGTDRYANLNRPGVLPFVGDCSSTLRDYYNWAGAPDPYRLGYNIPEGYTGTELDAGHAITPGEVRVGDAVVYGPGTGWHTALVVMRRGSDFLTMSMGGPGGPSLVWANPPEGPSLGCSYDGRLPQRWLAFDTETRSPRWPPGFTGSPSLFEAQRAGLRRLTLTDQSWFAEHGKTVWGWDGSWFIPEHVAPVLGMARWGAANIVVGA